MGNSKSSKSSSVEPLTRDTFLTLQTQSQREAQVSLQKKIERDAKIEQQIRTSAQREFARKLNHLIKRLSASPTQNTVTLCYMPSNISDKKHIFIEELNRLGNGFVVFGDEPVHKKYFTHFDSYGPIELEQFEVSVKYGTQTQSLEEGYMPEHSLQSPLL